MEFDQTRYRHRTVLVFDDNHHIVGKLSQLDILKALEPKYADMVRDEALSHLGFSRQFLRSMLEKYSLWDQPLPDICRRAANLQVKSFMYAPTEGEFTEEDVSMDRAVHQLVMGHHQSLLVTRGEKIVGIFRLTDVLREGCLAIKEFGQQA